MALFPRSPKTVVGLGLLLHLTYLLAMFDTYFHSPIVHIDKSHAVLNDESQKPLAQRLVLLVADGLRADLVFTPSGSPRVLLPEGEIMAPHLRSIIREKGAFGLSHARVPTESRPGHVALIGGLWEDPSAVFKGWKHNPVNFDSVLNQSSTSFTFGSPDILPIFGDRPPEGRREDDPVDVERKVLMWMYREEDEDFTSDANRLDVFSLDKFRDLLREGRINPRLDQRLRAPGVVFFLHLLGLDTTGHGYGPHSVEYIKNIQAVDKLVQQVEKEIEEFFQDNQTAFLFTADHGMSNIGNHGDGHPDSTRTPYVAWGSGVRGPIADISSSSHDEISTPWKLGSILRRDVDQVDLTMLMSALIGTNWPKNSVGILPDDLLRPGADEERTRAELLVGNAKSVMEQLNAKHQRIANRKLFFKPYSAMNRLGEQDGFKRIDQLQTVGDHSAAGSRARDMIALGLEGLTYYDTYDRTRLRTMVTIGYASFAIYTLLYVWQTYGGKSGTATIARPIFAIDALCMAVGLVALVSAIVEKTPWHVLYAALPIYLCRTALTYGWFSFSYSSLGNHRILTGFKQIARTAVYCVALIGMALGYKHRAVWSVGFLPLVWILFTGMRRRVTSLPVVTLLPCITFIGWALLPVERDESLTLLILGFLLNYGFTIHCFWRSCNSKDVAWRNVKRTFGVQLYFQAAVAAYTIWAIVRLRQKIPLGPLERGTGWILFAYSVIFPLATGFKPGQSAVLRLAILYNTFSASYMLLSQSWELIFLFNYAAVIAIWVQADAVASRPSSKHAHRSIDSSDAARALLFLFLVHAGFFCTGNVASISSFYLAPVYRLVPVFQPAIMSTLLMFKIVIPFILLSAAFASICAQQRLPPFALILLTLVMSEPICLFFFRQVQTTGSWLEIGSSISHFAIASLLIAYNVFLYGIGEYVMRGTTAIPIIKNE